MARTRTISSIETEIKKIENELEKLQEKQDVLMEKLLKLQTEKQEYESKMVMDAFKKSSKSFQELMTFLDV